MAARFSTLHGARVVLIEGSRDGGKKILISGGGRCNVLPSREQAGRFVTDSSPNLLKRFLRSWPLREQRSYFERDLRIPLALERETGKLFPSSNRAREVRDGLVNAAKGAGVETWFGTRVRSIGREGRQWSVLLDGAEPLLADRVVVATGGLSVPATGSDGAGLRWAESFGHTIHATYPALTPLMATPAVHADLAGISLDVTIHSPGSRPRFRTSGGFLFTHRGYSGPTVLDVSHIAVRSAMTGGERAEVRVCWSELDQGEWEKMLAGGAGTVGGAIGKRLPTRLAQVLAAEAGAAWDTPLAQLKRGERQALVRRLTDYPLPWTGDEGYKKAEVTGGGIALNEVDPVTLESRRAPGLHLCGEVLDAFGPIGGHNFAWAWATGRAAGEAAGRSASGVAVRRGRA